MSKNRSRAPRRAARVDHESNAAGKLRDVRRKRNPSEAEMVAGRLVSFFLNNDVCATKRELAAHVNTSFRTIERAMKLLQMKPRVRLWYDGSGRCFHLGERTFGSIDDYTVGDLVDLDLLPKDWEDRLDLALQTQVRQPSPESITALKQRLCRH